MNDNRQLHILRWPVMMPTILWNFRLRCLSLVALMVRPDWPARSSVNPKGSSFVISISFVIISKRCNIGDIYIIQIRSRNPGVTAQIDPPLKYTRVYSGLYLGIIWNKSWGIVWELPDYTPEYILWAPRVYPTCPDYTPSDSKWGIVWEIGVYPGRYYIWLQSIINLILKSYLSCFNPLEARVSYVSLCTNSLC